MKYRESGMPDEQQWQTYFEPEKILVNLGVNKNINTLLDIGCGYGSFLIPAATLVGGTVTGIDIEQNMIDICKKKVIERKLQNVKLQCLDINDNNVLSNIENHFDYICLFNILHCESPVSLLNLAYLLLNENGRIGIIHWKQENTPRGPSMNIRPSPENIINWACKANFTLVKQIDLPPYHFGIMFEKKYRK
jgi:cyclopropane fatty-acyl-phospholipid synthase-like methyltransferase